MPLKDPVAVYNAATNVEAQVLRLALEAEGIEAHVTEDLSTVGYWMLGLLPEIHKPQVWVDRKDIPRAKIVLDEYEKHESLRRAAQAAQLATQPPLQVICEECGQTTDFPGVQRGTVQVCPHCGEYIDVETPENLNSGEWQADKTAE